MKVRELRKELLLDGRHDNKEIHFHVRLAGHWMEARVDNIQIEATRVRINAVVPVAKTRRQPC